MPTTAPHLPLAHAYLRLAEGGEAPPRPRAATALVALLAALVLAGSAPLLRTAAAHSRADGPQATLPGKLLPAFADADSDGPGGG